MEIVIKTFFPSSPAASVLEPSPDNASAPKPKATCNFQKLMKQLREHFPTKTE
jgi:hypothetical protein